MTEAKPVISNHSSPAPSETASLPREERFRLALEAIPDGFMILQSIRDVAGEIADFSIDYINPIAASVVNLTQEELLGGQLLQLFPDCKTNGIFDGYVTVAETGVSTTFETFYESKAPAGWFRHVAVKLNDGIAVSFSDISDRKRAEADRQRAEAGRRQAELALQQQEQHFKVALQTAKLGSWEHDLITGVLTCSAQCKANFGLPPDAEFTHETLFAALHPDDRPLVQAAIHRAIAERTDYEVEERCYHPDGSLHWLIARGQLVYDSQGLPVRLVGVTFDITERKQTEIALLESQELFQSFMNHSPIAAFIKDENGRYLYANHWVEQVYQRSQSELIGRTDFELLPPAIAEQFYANDRAVLTAGQPMQMVETIHHEDGEHSYMSFKFPFCNAAGKQVLAGVAIDISERIQMEAALQQREAELRLITNAIPVLISFVDTEQRYRFNNQKYEEWFGKSAADMNGKYLWEVLGEAAYETIRPYVEQVLAGQEVTFESQIPYQEGGIRNAVVNYVPHVDQQGKVEGFVALVNDITHRKQAEETLRQSEERLRIAQQAANAGIWDWDILTNQVTWSEEYYRLYGLDSATTQPSYENWLGSIIEPDRDRVDQVAQEALERQIDLNVEFRILHPTFGERWLTAIGQTFCDDHRRPIRMTGIALDITERKRSEAALRESETRFQAIVRNLPGMLYRYTSHPDGSDAFTYVSAGSRELLELEPETIIQDSRSIWGLFHPDDLPGLRESVALVVKDLLPWQWEGRLITPSGQLKWVQGRSRPEHTEQGTVWNGLLIDITERKQAEEALRKSEERFQLIAKATNDVMWDCHLLTNKMWWSERLHSVFGYAPEDMEPHRTSWTERLHPDDAARVYASYETCLNSRGETWTDEYRFRRADGSYADILDRAYIIRDAAGHAVRVVGAMADISDRKQVQRELQQTLQTLRESEEWARLAIQVGRLGAWRLHLDTKLVEMDERMREIWGEPEDAVMISLPSVLERMHPDDRDRVASAVNAAIDPQSSGIYEIEYRIVWNDGTERWVLAKGQAQFAGEGASRQTVDFFGTLLDITDRKQAEEALRNSAERLSVALTAAKLGDWSWTAATDIVTFSEQAADLFGIPSGPYMTWTQMQTLLHPDDQQRARLQVEQAVLDHSDYDIEYRVIQADHTERWIAAKGRAQYDSCGQVLGMLGVVQDITPRKQAEAEREQLLARERIARKEAEQANRIKDEFLAVLSHELRSPLNPILGWVKLLQTRQFDEASTKRALETIERNAKLQTQLIDDLLDVSRILRGKLLLNVSPIDLETVIDAALETVRLSAEAKGINIQKVIASDLTLVAGDSGRLQQIVWNLLSNAVKFTLPQGRIEIRLEQVGTEVQIQVKDTGKGITPEFLPHVFEYFRQEDGTTTRKFGGLGLGLAIVRYLTELHGGIVKAESPGEGQGATFTVRLPLQRGEKAAEGEREAIPTHRSDSYSDPSGTADCPLTGLRVLGVDDDADMRELMLTVLKQTGAEAIVVASAMAALEVLNSFKPDVLISDIGMPEMDGYALIHHVRGLSPAQGGRIPAIALTAYAGEINQQRALAAGFQKHLSKPVAPEELMQAIVTLVKSR